MKNKNKLILLALVLLILSSCSKKDRDYQLKDNQIYIYCLNNSKTKLVKEVYNPVATDRKALVREILAVIEKGPENISYNRVLGENIEILSFVFEKEDILKVNFSINYSQLDQVYEVLSRAAIVKTLSQIEDISYIEFNVADQPLKDPYGKAIGLMTKDDFIESTSMQTNYKASLYFTNKKGDKLIEYNTTLVYAGSRPIEEMVVQALIDGPKEEGYYRTVGESTKIINIISKDGVTYVNLNEKFVESKLDVSDEITIYSIVNSLAEIPNISKIQFLINGETRKLFRENLEFDQFFERNLAIIDGEK